MDEYKSFHRFVFKYHLLKPGQKTLDIESAIVLLNITVRGMYPTTTDKFVKFLRATDTTAVTGDQWNNVVEVFPLIEQDGKYDVDDSCKISGLTRVGPTIFDEFYEWLKGPEQA